MSSKENNQEAPWQGFHGPNLGVVIELYDEFLKDANAVDPDLREKFELWGPPPTQIDTDGAKGATGNTLNPDMMTKVVSAVKLADMIRAKGHLVSNINPILRSELSDEFISLERFQLTKEDLLNIPAGLLMNNAPAHLRNGFDVIEHLKNRYTKTTAFEFEHIQDEEERIWLRNAVESGDFFEDLTTDKKKDLLKRLTEVEGFEKFIHRTFVGQKRFSIEGLDTLVPMLDESIDLSMNKGTKNVMIGMAHRGRLNVLAHTLAKPYNRIFSEFLQAPKESTAPTEGGEEYNDGWTGDVKYHLGENRIIEKEQHSARVTLANNPSHLEFVSPIVEGYARAAQEDRSEKGQPKQDVSKALAILIHGDAAFPGQGVVTETLNLSRLNGYQIGGSLHIIANNNIGYTTEIFDSRSTTYASDPAKGFEIPIVHVNADDAEACVKVTKVAIEYRKRFKKDFLIDLIGYRRYGHNEGDEPAVTQPVLYDEIRKHPTVRELYARQLEEAETVKANYGKQLDEEQANLLQEEYDSITNKKSENKQELSPPGFIVNGLPKVKTQVERERLESINEQLLQWPDNFKPNQKLEKILNRRLDAFKENGALDWGLGEYLAFATILADGTPIRLTGQDTERGTFAHRHAVLHDRETNKTITPLHEFEDGAASFSIYNSPLSEQAAVGYEYGYNVFSPETLVLWEAQFGDFSNGAQVMLDQWVSAARAKWGQKSGLVLLLPHGYEGMGPEHSSARLERFLQMAAENNWTVANCTSAAQYFHILRRQAAILQKNAVRPLIIMTPKSLLRNKAASSKPAEFTDGEFLPVLEHTTTGSETEKVERVVLCSGKIGVELNDYLAKNQEEDTSWIHIARVEELYPFPRRVVRELLQKFPNLKEVKWVQEEPKNMGAWTFMESRILEILPEEVELSYIGRTYRSSPAEGVSSAHKTEQSRIVNETFTRKN
ncbi:2-oxoglutarate dehydrogenase E1 component [Alkalicoccobacillus gibsonii]|uniref:2-oxoglutarate dehydrogenase E1 component n=1 Tax=Alkalicoccobacillus gibsonii TaxID=79881 RepID=UPI003513E304